MVFLCIMAGALVVFMLYSCMDNGNDDAHYTDEWWRVCNVMWLCLWCYYMPLHWNMFVCVSMNNILKVGESLQEAGLDRKEANVFLIACNSMIAGIRESLFRKLDRLDKAKKQRKINIIEMDWIRFVLCCRICLWNMFDVLLTWQKYYSLAF